MKKYRVAYIPPYTQRVQIQPESLLTRTSSINFTTDGSDENAVDTTDDAWTSKKETFWGAKQGHPIWGE